MKLLNVFLLLFMACIQAEDAEAKKEMPELLDPNDPHNLALFKKQALEHEARWNAMSREEQEVARAKRHVDHTTYDFTEEEINHIYGDSHEALLEEGLHEAAASLMAEWTEVKESMSTATDRRRLQRGFRAKGAAREAIAGSCQGSSGWDMGECLASFDYMVDMVTKAEAYVKAKTEPFCGLADHLTEYDPFNIQMGNLKVGFRSVVQSYYDVTGKSTPDIVASNANTLCRSIDMHACQTHAWACLMSYGLICFTDACAKDAGRCLQENFTTFANWANVAVSLAGMFFTGGASNAATNAAVDVAQEAAEQGVKAATKTASKAANPFFTDAMNPFINPFFKSADAGISAAQKAGSKTLSRQVARSMSTGTLSDSAAAATRASISNTLKQTGKAMAANMKKNLYNYFWAEVKDTITDSMMHLVAEELVFMAVVGEQKTTIANLGDLAWELAELADPTGIATVARYYIERPECIFDKPILKAADVQALTFKSVGLKPFASYQSFSTCPISHHLGYWNSPNSCAGSEAMLKCESKKYQWRSGDDMCSCCVDSDKSKYKPEPCVGLVDGGCGRDDGYTLSKMVEKKDGYGKPSQRLNVLNPWNVYEANDMTPCPDDYVLTFPSEANGGCDSAEPPQFEETVASLAACAAMCTNSESCRSFNYKNDMCVGFSQCSKKQKDGNGEISCTRNPCPANWVPYFAGSFAGGCETTEDSIDKAGTMRTELGDLTAAECAQRCSNEIDCMAIEMMDRADPIHRPEASRCTLIKKCLRQTQEFQTLTCRPIFETHCPEGYTHREGWQQPSIVGEYQIDMAFLDLTREMTRQDADFRMSDERVKLLRQIRDNGNERYTKNAKYSAFTMEECKLKCESARACSAFQFSPRMKNCFTFENISKPNRTAIERDFRFCARDGYSEEKPLVRLHRDNGISSYCKKASEKESTLGKILGFKGIDMCTECQGECENDSECAGSLKCYIRDNKETAFDADKGDYMHYRQHVPGCMTKEEQLRRSNVPGGKGGESAIGKGTGSGPGTAEWKGVSYDGNKKPAFGQNYRDAARGVRFDFKQRDDKNYCYDSQLFKKDCSYKSPVATGQYICKAKIGGPKLADLLWEKSALWIWDAVALQKTVNTETEKPSEFGGYLFSKPKWYYMDDPAFYAVEDGKTYFLESKAKKAGRSADRGFLVENEDECRRACDGRVECEFYLYLLKKTTNSRLCYLGKNYEACHPIEADERVFDFAKIQQKNCRGRNEDHSGYRQRADANMKCKTAKYMARNIPDAHECAMISMQYQSHGIKHFSYNEYIGECRLSENCDDTYQEKSYLYKYLGFGKCHGVFEAVKGEDASKVTVLKMHKYLQKRRFKKLSEGKEIQTYYISDELECERACTEDDECKFFMAGATKFDVDNLCYLWKTDCNLMVPPRHVRFLDIDPPLDGWAVDLADAKEFTNIQLLKNNQHGHWRLPSKSTSQYSDSSFVRLKKGFLVQKKLVLNSDNKGFNWGVYDLVQDADTKTYEHGDFITFDNHYCPEACELCKDGDLPLINGRCHGKCSFDGKCGSVGIDCSGCSHKKYLKSPAPFIRDNETEGKFCDGSGVDSKVKSRKECEEKANVAKASFYSYAKTFGPQGEEVIHCMHSSICVPEKRKKKNDIPWQIYYKPQTYRLVAHNQKCVKGKKLGLAFILRDQTPAQSRRTIEDCEALAMWYGFQFFSFKEGSDDVGYCEIAQWTDCLKQQQFNDWKIYSRGYPRAEEEIALASFEESDSGEEPEVIDITENVKITPGLEESVSTLPRVEEEIALATFEESDSGEDPEVIDITENVKIKPGLEESASTLEMIEPKFSAIQVFAVIGVIFISYSAYKRCNKSDYVDVPSGVEPEEI